MKWTWLDVFNPASKDQYGIMLPQFDKMLVGGKNERKRGTLFCYFLAKAHKCMLTLELNYWFMYCKIS